MTSLCIYCVGRFYFHCMQVADARTRAPGPSEGADGQPEILQLEASLGKAARMQWTVFKPCKHRNRPLFSGLFGDLCGSWT